MQFFTKLAGVTHDGRQQIIRNLYRFGELDAGTQVFLKPEPNNPYDPNAVAVLTANGQHLGYIPKENARQIVINMRAGMVYHAYVSAVTGGDAGYAYGVNLRIEYENIGNQTNAYPSCSSYEVSPGNNDSCRDSGPSLSTEHSAAYMRCINGLYYMCNENDFEVRDGVLIQYTGKDKHVFLPSGITEIGKKAFCRCSMTTHIYLCEGIKTIETYAFSDCISLEDVRIPDGVETIEASAFDGCKSLKTIQLPDSVKSIGLGAFRNCFCLDNITLPAGITKIEEGTFVDCYNLKSIIIPDKVLSIHGDSWCGAFEGCSRLSRVNIPDSVVDIGRDVFKASALVTIVASLGSYAEKYAYQYGIRFQEDESARKERLEKETGSSSSREHHTAYTRCINGITYICNEDDFEIDDGVLSQYTGKDKHVLLPSGITEICDKAFCGAIFKTLTCGEQMVPTNCYEITHVYMQDGVEFIGERAFAYCECLEAIRLPDSVDTIEESAFENCVNLEIVNIPDGLDELGASAFSGCEKITTIKIPKGVSVIKPDTFLDCCALENLTLPTSLTEIGEGAFDHCSSLKNIVLPNTLTCLGECALLSCSSLEHITLPAGITKIERGVFAQCANLKTITIPDSVRSIAGRNGWIMPGAFEECPRLERVTIPDSVVSIEKDVFKASPLVTIVASLGSYAEKYARQYGIRFQEDENARKERLEKERQAKEHIYLAAINKETLAKTDQDYLKIIDLLQPIEDYRDSRLVIQECHGKIRAYRQSKGLCLECGGEFKGLFWKKCSVCNQAKNY